MLSGVLEKALNRYLQLDPEAPERLAALEGKSLHLTVAAFRFQVTIREQRFQVSSEANEPADLKIKGSPLSLLSLALSRNKKTAFAKSGLSLEGDAELAQELLDLFQAMEIDWEEPLSRVLGDFPAQKLSGLTRGIMSFGIEAKERLFQNVQDYIHEERPWFPPEPLLETFYQEVDELRLSADRLEARVKNLKG